MVANSSDAAEKSLQIKEDDKFFSRLRSKESSTADSSASVYYGRARGAVPFLWESQPGTPKATSPGGSASPVTPPPPSCTSNSNKQRPSKHSIYNSLQAIHPKNTNTGSKPPSPSSSVFSSPCPSTSSTTTTTQTPTLSSDSKKNYEEPASTFCLGMGHEGNAAFRGCYSIELMKNALLSIVGHGSGHGTA